MSHDMDDATPQMLWDVENILPKPPRMDWDISLPEAIARGTLGIMVTDLHGKFFISVASKMSFPNVRGNPYFLPDIFRRNFNGHIAAPNKLFEDTERFLAAAYGMAKIIHCAWVYKFPGATLVTKLYTAAAFAAAVRANDDSDPVFLVQPAAGEYVSLKDERSNLTTPETHGFLNSNKIKTLILTGIFTSQCIHRTLIDARKDGIKIILIPELLRDPMGSQLENGYDRAQKLREIYGAHIVILPLAEAIKVFDAHAAQYGSKEARRPLPLHIAAAEARGIVSSGALET